jgi:RNA polymerase sigma factor (sigma-70 family)
VNVEEVSVLVEKARSGDLDAFGELVVRFQNMAYGCAYAVLSDFHMAQDAAQDAFIEAHRSLGNLKDARAFPGWFRRIVLRVCSRLTRRKKHAAASIEAATAASHPDSDPAERAAAKDLRDRVLDAVRLLPEDDRMVTTLFYIDGYSHKEIADFLEVPVGTVKSRLHTSRKRLKKRMMNMVSDQIKSHPLPDDFRSRALEQACKARDEDAFLMAGLPDREELLRTPPDRRPSGSERLFELLASKKDWIEILRELDVPGNQALAALVVAKKALFNAMTYLIRKYPEMAKAKGDTDGATLLHAIWAPIEGADGEAFEEFMRMLIDCGADVNAKAGDRQGTPLHNIAATNRISRAGILLEHGADVNIQAEDGATPLVVAVLYDRTEMIEFLLVHGAKIDLATHNGFTPLHVAAWHGCKAAAQMLLDHGADINKANDAGRTPLEIARERGHDDLAALIRSRS